MNRVPFNALGRFSQLEKKELTATFGNVIDSGVFLLGEQNSSFESELAEYLNTAHVISCGNGTDAIVLSLRALGVTKNDSVLTAANAGGYSTTAINIIGAIPVYADVDADSHLLTPENLETAYAHFLGPKPKAVVVTHLYGAAANMGAICAWAEKRKIWVIEDCAQALGALWGSAKVGTFGDVATTSFYPTKNLGALGDGGAVFTNNSSVHEEARSLRQYGWKSKYETTRLFGTNSRLDEMQAAVLRLRLGRLDEENERRREIHKRFESASTGSPRFVNTASPQFIGHLAVVEVSDRSDAIKHFDDLGIETAIHYPIPDHRQAIETRPIDWNLPVTEKLSGSILSLPLFPGLTDSEIFRVEEAIACLPGDK
jgi:dTDP-4-amino-4,6-dideoxygalactose transaminase